MLRLKRHLMIGVIKIWDLKDGKRVSITLEASQSPEPLMIDGIEAKDEYGYPVFDKTGKPFSVNDENFVLKNYSGILEKTK